MLQKNVGLAAMVLASVPAAPVFRFVMYVPFVKFDEVALPKAAVIIGRGTSPATPETFAKVFPLPAAMFLARLPCAFLNSFRNPFSTVLTSLMLYPSHWCRDRLPT